MDNPTDTYAEAVEITAAMVQAGVLCLADADGLDLADQACLVFGAMTAARKRTDASRDDRIRAQ